MGLCRTPAVCCPRARASPEPAPLSARSNVASPDWKRPLPHRPLYDSWVPCPFSAGWSCAHSIRALFMDQGSGWRSLPDGKLPCPSSRYTPSPVSSSHAGCGSQIQVYHMPMPAGAHNREWSAYGMFSSRTRRSSQKLRCSQLVSETRQHAWQAAPRSSPGRK